MPPGDPYEGLESLEPVAPAALPEASPAAALADLAARADSKQRSLLRNGRANVKRKSNQVQSLVLTLAGMLALSVAGFGVYRLFEAARSHVSAQTRFQVSLRDIEVTPLPVWIHCDLLAEVQRSAGLPDAVNTLNRDLAEELHGAFAMNPWVREVVEVRVIHPSTIRVKLTYREPVALVASKRSLEAVDREGVLLPTTELPDAQIYLTITNVRSTPTGPAGTKWDDPAVGAAVAVADALSPQHRTLGLTTIDMGSYQSTGSGQGQIYLLTEQGTRVKWGRPPIVDYPGEVPVQDKIDRLTQYFTDNGSLDKPAGPYDIDITHWQDISIRPRSQATIKNR